MRDVNGGGLLEAVVAARLMPVSVPVAAVVAAAVIILDFPLDPISNGSH